MATSGACSVRASSISLGLVSRWAGRPWSCSSTKRLSRPKMSCSRPAFSSAAALVALQQRLQDVAAEAAGGGDEALVVLLEQLPVEAGLVVVALEEGPAGELDEVAVAALGLGQQREVVVELLAALGVAAGVVDAAPPGRPLAAVVVGHVGLGADDRLDPLLAALLVELEGAVHVAVIGHPDRRLAVGDGLGHQLVQPGGAVEHRELGVDVEVGERIPHSRPFSRVWRRRTGPADGANDAAVISSDPTGSARRRRERTQQLDRRPARQRPARARARRRGRSPSPRRRPVRAASSPSS